MTSFAMERVHYEKVGRVARVTLNRPEKLNAMDARMHEELKDVWDDVERDESVLIAVLTGAGDRAFSVGQDLKETAIGHISGCSPTSFGAEARPGAPRLTERFGLKKPVIARVNGLAIGGGFELALACDIIIAVEGAQFALPEARLGMIPGAGGLFRLYRQIPPRIAIGYMMTGRYMSSSRAYDLGLVNEVVPKAQLDACVDEWIESISSCSPLAIRAVKEVSIATAELPIEKAFRVASSCPAEIARRESSDCLEGPRAFTEKRKPRWKGN